MNIRSFISILVSFAAITAGNKEHADHTNNCVTFSVSQGTGCAWMCNYCATKLGTNNYYFTDNVCTYIEGYGCVGSPYSGVSYTCCASTI